MNTQFCGVVFTYNLWQLVGAQWSCASPSSMSTTSAVSSRSCSTSLTSVTLSSRLIALPTSSLLQKGNSFTLGRWTGWQCLLTTMFNDVLIQANTYICQTSNIIFLSMLKQCIYILKLYQNSNMMPNRTCKLKKDLTCVICNF